MTKEIEYAVKLNEQIAAMFDEDCENYINPSDFDEENNATAFFHALANVMPTRFYNKMTNSDEDVLAFNHIANRLCFQFSNVSK